MRRTPIKKAGIVALTATAIVVIFVATALAAPVLQPGVTSAPGMSGVCTDCHVYAKTPATPPVVTPPVVTPPTVTPPVVTPPSAGEGHESDEAGTSEVKKTESKVTTKASHKKHIAHKSRSHKRD
jgi:hypothetical protein